MIKNKTKKSMTTTGKLGVLGLAAIVVSSMIGGGIFSLPQNMAQSASVGVEIFSDDRTVFQYYLSHQGSPLPA